MWNRGPKTATAPKPDSSYRRHRESARARQAEIASQGRDIGELPETENPKRRAKAERSFKVFAKTYFPDVFDLDWSDDHLRVIHRIEQAVQEGRLFAVAMPRGSGKTVLLQCAVLWSALIGATQFVVLIAASSDRGEELLEDIKIWLETNDTLNADFPEVTHPIRKLERITNRQKGQQYRGVPTRITWVNKKIVLPTIKGSNSSGVVITSSGMQGADIRGQHHARPDGRVVRPDLAMIDDPQTTDSAYSITQSQRREAILAADVLGMAGPGKRLAGLMACTVIRPGDMADNILDRDKHPEWQGERTKLVYRFPTDQKLWDRYAELRAEGLREGDDGAAATEFYRRNRKAMDAGAIVAWPQRHDPHEISAVQNAMNLKLRDEASFYAEYQNEPLSDHDDDEVLSPDQVAEKVSGRQRNVVPKAATTLTAFVDVQDRMLFYCVCAWESDFTGHVIDYGTLPDQKRAYFSYRKPTKTLQMLFKGVGIDGAIQAGLEQLVGELIATNYQVAGAGGTMQIERLLIDAGHKPELVEAACQKLPANVMPARGVGIKASNRPMSQLKRKRGEKHGHHWYVPNVAKTREMRHVRIDTNYWKTFIHARFATAAGDPGSLTLFGRTAARHRLIADHVAASETWTRTEGHGRSLQEWAPKPSKPDNHWFDCLVGAAAAASMCGIRQGGEPTAVVSEKPRKRIKLSALQKARS